MAEKRDVFPEGILSPQPFIYALYALFFRSKIIFDYVHKIKDLDKIFLIILLYF